MNKKLLLAAIALTASTSVFAEGYAGSNTVTTPGFSGPSQGISTVKEVLDTGVFSDDLPVTLTGHIKSSLGGEMYMFTDKTGEITVEIDHDKWMGQSATPESTVQLYGEIDKGISGTKVDVEVLKVLPVSK
ncbi:hypothetical protein DZ860_15560 [Vibrio sinensis]|uniref:Uncharacterized protein n=1 Tax=Vibrio sinensis TaxID=2302434 RepID=A0A3A6QAX1_9VIBR|nr:NirD/YgiW/YdeI family stress tolerance protein [Vibrio sinensis]RJX69401.1 hypothetical protein DZ860_15560 [Vibrio sinensis]